MPALPPSSEVDTLHITLRRPAAGKGGAVEVVHRWWRIVRPRPSVAFALQSRVVAVFGPAYERAALALLKLMDPAGGTAGSVDARMAAEVAGMGGEDALALETFRRASTGRGIVDAGEDVVVAGARLRAALTFAVRHAGSRLDADALAGEYAGDGPAGEIKWGRVGLVHRVLYDSQLEFGGGKAAAFDDGAAGVDQAVEALVSSLSAGPTQFVEALDGVVTGAEELRLLGAWAVLHLLRPF